MRAMHCVIMFVHPSLTQVHDGARVILGCQDVDVTSIQDQRVIKIIVTISRDKNGVGESQTAICLTPSEQASGKINQI